MNAQRNPRKRFRFSLLTILIMVSIVGSIIGWIGSVRLKYASQQKAAAALDGLALSKFWWNSEEKSRFSIDSPRLLRNRHTGPAVIETYYPTNMPLFELITGQRSHTEIISVELQHLEIYDADLVHVNCLPDLMHLNLDNTAVTDAGVQALKPNKNLRYLCLGQSNISDKALEELDKFSQLKELDLWINDISDVGLQHLSGLKQLETLNVCMTNVTETGIREIQKSLPKCRIWWDGDEAFKRINRLPTYDKPPKGYNPAAAIESVNYFLALGKDNTINAMREYVRFTPGEATIGWPGEYCQTRLRSLMSLLFVPERPELGIPLYPGLNTNVPIQHDWPYTSIYIEGEIPFALEFPGNRFDPLVDQCGWLVEWADGNCNLRAKPIFPVNNPKAAADRLYKQLAKGPRSTWPNLERDLKRQAERMIEHVENKNETITWNAKSQRYEVVNRNESNQNTSSPVND